MDIVISFAIMAAILGLTALSAVFARRYGVQFMIASVATLMVIVNVLNTKLITIGSWVVPGGIILFPCTFLLTDVISEKYGKRYAMQSVFAGFFGLVVYVVCIVILGMWSSPEFATDSAAAFSQLFVVAPRIVLASFAAYLVGQTHDVWAFHYLKRKTKGKHLWLRNNASTVVSQFVDSVVFVVIAFLGVVPSIWSLIFTVYAIKVVIAALDTPFVYAMVRILGTTPRGDRQ